MSWCYRHIIRPNLFKHDAEQVHEFTLGSLGWVSRHQLMCDALEAWLAPAPLPVHLFGLQFPNPIGLAAGMDKLGVALPAWEALGFGFAEIGAVTWHPQPGNPPPRLFRAVAEQAIVNRMGFNNHGAEALASVLTHWRTQHRWPAHPIGINLGKSKTTPLDQAAADYASSFRRLHALADFFVVNVSSPNTPNLRQLQDRSALEEILLALREAQSAEARHSAPKPILIKIAPDLSFAAIDELLQLTETGGTAGIVATNTTLARPDTADPVSRRVFTEAGGLSGRPLRTRSTEVIRHIHRQTRGKLPIIGVGGIFTAADAWEKITAGASLLQIYTGLVYEGPALIKALVTGLRDRVNELGLTNLQQAVGLQASDPLAPDHVPSMSALHRPCH
ncbi:MAG TPA: quinone-dependent dihydroorotate dehydrogenase, partial [Verrucomicrobiota bacterium]|nr:quinone-dependent dihydroorotate dehydrogenase [Verrucomicrobiota bacterium]HNT14783.1 quinone-dependent dihydroorotate dehydrogenase [Verrucomicrobiota bacterium]